MKKLIYITTGILLLTGCSTIKFNSFNKQKFTHLKKIKPVYTENNSVASIKKHSSKSYQDSITNTSQQINEQPQISTQNVVKKVKVQKTYFKKKKVKETHKNLLKNKGETLRNNKIINDKLHQLKNNSKKVSDEKEQYMVNDIKTLLFTILIIIGLTLLVLGIFFIIFGLSESFFAIFLIIIGLISMFYGISHILFGISGTFFAILFMIFILNYLFI